VNETLRELMVENGLSRSQTARLLMVADTTVDRYLAPKKRKGKPNPQFRTVPEFRIVLLRTALKGRKKKTITR